MQKRIGKVIIVNADNEVLLLKRGGTAPTRPLTWETPGGVVERDETVEQGALREVQEETAIKLDDAEELYTKRMPWGNKWTFFYAEVNEAEVKISWEHDEFTWHPVDKLHELKELPDFYKQDLDKALAQAGKL